jgi:D-xylose transport system substrate-binding protein
MMRKAVLTVTVGAAALALGVAGCSSSSSGSTTKTTNNKVGVLLPDTASSPRWNAADPNEIQKECVAYSLDCIIDNANGSATTQEQQAQAMFNAGVGVILLVDLDSASGATIEKEANQHGIVAIDYDRLTQGGTAAYYVSFDNVQVGKDQGTALTQCPEVASLTSVNYVDIDGAPTDNNATLFAEGYDSVLSAKSGWTRLDKQTGNWDPATAQSVFQKMLQAHSNINAVMVANDTMAQSVINVLSAQGLQGKVAVSGQDATVGGLDNIMTGDQCFSIYKPVAGEADVAVKLASEILKGQKPTAPTTLKDPSNGREVPSYLANPTVITKANVSKPVLDGYVTAASVCSTAALVTLCNANGISYTPSS